MIVTLTDGSNRKKLSVKKTKDNQIMTVCEAESAVPIVSIKIVEGNLMVGVSEHYEVAE